MTALADETARALPVADVTIGGLPFFFAIDDEHPYQRQTMPWKRQQIDTSSEPGEQTMSQYWVRDQDSWHRGAGINFYDPGADPYSRYRFNAGVGIDVWQVGDLKLLHTMARRKVASSGDVGACSAVRNGVDGAYYTMDGVLGFYGSTGTTTDFTMGSLAAATEPILAGSKVMFGTTTGIASATVGNENATLAPLWTIAAGAVVQPWWVKSRIIAARGNALYELTLAGGAIGTALYTHPDASWEWTSVTETPDAILCAGRSSGYSAIYALTLSTSGSAGATPTLGPMAQVAEFPPGEEVFAIKAYLGSFLGVGTTHGVRIADIGNNGQMRYGPLTIETTAPVRCLAVRGSFLYAGIENDLEGNSGAARVNLSEEITSTVNGLGDTYVNTLRYAWAYDVQIGAGTQDVPITGITFVGGSDDVVLGARANGLFVTSHTDYVNYGTLTSGKIRFSTAEQKVFAFAKLRCTVPANCKAEVFTIDESGNEALVATILEGDNESADIPLTLASTPQSFISLKIKLYSSTVDNLTTPLMRHVQLKALPRPSLQREMGLPLRLADREESRNGTIIGYPGWAFDRLTALEQMQQDNVIVTITDTTCGESFSGMIEDVKLTRNTPPSRNLANFGGVLSVTVVKL